MILASASPRRRALLEPLFNPLITVPADIDETPQYQENPRDYVVRMAEEKALNVQAHAIKYPEETLILAADTAVVCEGHIFGKPQDRSDAIRMLEMLSDNTHQVLTATCILSYRDHAWHMHTRLDKARVTFYPLSEQEIEAYLSSDEPWDKAGAYAIQGKAQCFVKALEGNLDTIIGLPLNALLRDLKNFDGYQDLVVRALEVRSS